MSFSDKSSSYYDILGVSPTASNAEIKDAFLKLSKKHHPDVTKLEDGHDDFVKINEAYTVLSKPSTRREYDFQRTFSRHAGAQYGGGVPPWRAEMGKSEAMYQNWYRSVYKRRMWRPEDDFGPEIKDHSDEAIRRTIYLLAFLVVLALMFQAYILSVDQERQHQKLIDDRQRWMKEFQSKMKPKEMDTNEEKVDEVKDTPKAVKEAKREEEEKEKEREKEKKSD